MNAFMKSGGSLDALRDSESRARARIAEGQPLDALNDLLTAIETHSDNEMIAQVMLLDEAGSHLTRGAGPSLSDGYSDAVEGLEVGAAAGCSLGASVFYGEAIIASDIAVDPLWAEKRDAALSHGLRACWSTPVRATDGRIMGTFATYYRKPRSPALSHLEAIAVTIDAVALALAAHEQKIRREA